MNAMTTIKPSLKIESRSVSPDQVTHEDTFWFRNGGIEAAHCADLASTLRNTGRALDPILVWQPHDDQPDCLILLDGAHRLTAYELLDWAEDIPANVLVGADRRTAIATALSANSKRVLGLSQAERLDAAWRLVREPVVPRFKVKEIARLADVAGRTVDKMRARHRFMHEESIEITGSWARDQRTIPADDDVLDSMTDAVRDAQIDKLAEDIRDLTDRRKHPDRAILRDTHAVWEAMQRAFGERAFKDMLAYILGDDEEADDWLELASAGASLELVSAASSERDDAQDADDPDPQF